MAGLLALMQEERVSHTLCVPSLYKVMLEESERISLDSLAVVTVAAEPSDAALVEMHERRFPKVPLVNEYGPTEATVWASAGHLLQQAGPITVGAPIAGARIEIRTPSGAQLPLGWPGELWIGGAGVASGYLNRPQETAARFVARAGERYYRTGDRARILPTREVELLGRVDNQIKLRGYRIEPEEIEQVLLAHPAVAEAAVVVQRQAPSVEMLRDALVGRVDALELIDTTVNGSAQS